jgi:hypothetical protein
MRWLMVLMAIGALWGVDRLAFDGRYNDAFWREAKYQGELFNHEIGRWLDKLSR